MFTWAGKLHTIFDVLWKKENSMSPLKMSILNFFKKVDKLTAQDDVAESNSSEPEMDVEYLLNCDENSSMNDEDQLSAEEEKIQEEPSDSAEPVPTEKRSRNFEAIKSYSFQQPDCESLWADSAIPCSSKAEVYPNLSKLMKALLVMNVQNASVERGF
uniref:HAT C-terminal dimerisation domain-containing protein n=1 Tax=Romanomermis culicivorax TaxID=13658 RepID=A0A915L044_ROMCU